VTSFTGERPGRGRGYEYDDSRHRVAYHHAAGLVEGLDVVDAGSGDGEGAALLARRARRVVGLDHDHGAVVQARRDHPEVVFVEADLAMPWPTVDADVVVALQVIEHFEDDDAFVARALGAVRPGGLVLLTTPNRLQSFSENPYHVREYTAAELSVLLARHGEDVGLQGVFGNAKVAAFDARRRAEVEKWLRLDPLRLRDRLPSVVVERAFAVLSTVVRRGASDGGDEDPITVDDFEVRDGDLDVALDLVATLRRPR
jgi:2-polyprenyl-3-methyl-5-hydroxy-6-metoxy-1,4-benzoquinol methylase